jgi:LPS-assembly lipoprotein
MSRRQTLRFISRVTIASLIVPWMTACGFRLRGQVNYNFSSIHINGTRVPALANEMKNILSNVNDLRVVENSRDAEVILEFTDVVDDKEVLSLTSGGRAREYSLTQSVSFRLYDKTGEDWIPPDTIMIERTFLYDDSERLAREIQEQEISREIQRDTAQQIMRYLQRARRPQ